MSSNKQVPANLSALANAANDNDITVTAKPKTRQPSKRIKVAGMPESKENFLREMTYFWPSDQYDALACSPEHAEPRTSHYTMQNGALGAEIWP